MKKYILVIASLLLAAAAVGQEKFSYADIAAGKFRQKTVSGVRSMADGETYTAKTGASVVKYAYATGQALDTVVTLTGLVDNLRSFNDYAFNRDETRLLVRTNSVPVYRRSSLSAYGVYDIPAGTYSAVSDRADLQYATLSPDGRMAAYVADNDVYVENVGGDQVWRVTEDGSHNIINGFPDWVYEEEFALTHALSWSPQGDRVAYLRFDQTAVKDYYMMNHRRMDASQAERYRDGEITLPHYNSVTAIKYPKAGEQNSVVELYVYEIASGRKVKVDVGTDADQYVPFFDWTPDGQLYFYRINRLQNHLQVILTDDAGRGRVIYEERSEKYIDEIAPSTITFLPDSKRFIVRNETAAGRFHLYMYSIDRGLRYAITRGDWDVTSVAYAGEEGIWYVSNEVMPIRRDLYKVDIKGRNKKMLSGGDGTYHMSASRGGKYYISYFSNSTTPNRVELRSGEGELIRVLEDNAQLKSFLADLKIPEKEFCTLTRDMDGESRTLYYYIVRPADFDPAKKYPVLFTQYSGPGSQQVLDRWSVDWEEVMVQEGYIVACVDPRGTSGQGEEFKKLTYGRMGELETQDQIAFARHIAQNPYVDSQRLGIYGWSYGGFMALNCILHGADVYKMAISVAPVTSWRYYDSIYTERVNGLPEDNAEGYDMPSPLFHADKLQGRLLIIHGTADDNVHVQNTYSMVSRLVELGKKFDMMIYPDSNHSMMPYGHFHVRQKMVDYCLENL